jgi:hypothetical protein
MATVTNKLRQSLFYKVAIMKNKVSWSRRKQSRPTIRSKHQCGSFDTTLAYGASVRTEKNTRPYSTTDKYPYRSPHVQTRLAQSGN